jgi:hypothetical protein
MHKIFLFTYLFVSFSNLLFSQDSQLETISVCGNSNQIGEYDISWSLGQVVIESYMANDLVVTQGIHQPFVIITHILQDSKNDLEIKAYPNPAHEFIIVELKKETKLSFIISSSNGKIVFNGDLLNKVNKIELKQIPPGSYILKISGTESNAFNSYNIIKL